VAPALSDEAVIGWLRDLDSKRDADREADRQRWSVLTGRLDSIDDQLAELQRCGLDESRATLSSRAECQRVIGERLDKLERRDLLSLVWDSRKTIIGIMTGLLGIVSVAAAAVAPILLPILDRMRQVAP
jgi:hypothetical protein